MEAAKTPPNTHTTYLPSLNLSLPPFLFFFDRPSYPPPFRDGANTITCLFIWLLGMHSHMKEVARQFDFQEYVTISLHPPRVFVTSRTLMECTDLPIKGLAHPISVLLSL